MAGTADSLPIAQRLQAIHDQLALLREGTDEDALAAQVAALEERMQAPGFWDDQAAAASVNTEHSRATRRLERWRSLTSDVDDLEPLAEMAAEDDSMASEL